jgi:hypothetical protein
MRHNARYTEGSYGSAAFLARDPYSADGFEYPHAEYPGPEANVDLANLHPGGMTHEIEPGIARFLQTSSPEPVIGYCGMKGIFMYYLAVLHFGTLPK